MIRLVEQMVLNPPKGKLHDWRFYRIEYPDGIEGLVWLPKDVKPELIECVLNWEYK